MFAHDVKVLSHDVIQVLKGTNHKQVMPTLIVAPDPIDKMVEKEMAQLKSIKDEEEREEMINEHKIEHTNVLEVLSKFSTEELIEALKLKEDVQAHETTEDTYKVSMDLTEVKKHVLVINNCNPHLVERRRMLLEVDRYLGEKNRRRGYL